MGARFIVETKQLQRILAAQRIVPAFKCGGVDRQRADNFVFLQLPAGGNLCESAGVDFNFAGRGFERMRFRIAPEVAIGDEVLWSSFFGHADQMVGLCTGGQLGGRAGQRFVLCG